MALDLPAAKDVVIGALGGAAGLGGLVLVFLGVVVSAYQSFPGGTPATVKRPLKAAGWSALGVLAISLACVAAAFAWLLVGGGDQLFIAVVALFLVQLGAILAVAVAVTKLALG
jgi:hypothetical protein